MAYHTSQFSGGATLAVEGKMDEEFLEQVRACLADSRPRLLINLERSQAIRGDHMEWMVEAHHLCDQAGGAMALTDVPKDFRYILSIMQLDQFFRLFETQAEGERTFAAAPPARAEADKLQVVELAAPSEAPPVPEKPARAPRGERAEREARVELFVRYVAPGMAYLYVFEVLAKGGSRRFDLKGLARASRQKPAHVTEVIEHLVSLRICKRLAEKGTFAYNPGQAAKDDVALFLQMWNNPNNHGKVYKWVFAEEQARKGDSSKEGLSSRIRRWLGR